MAYKRKASLQEEFKHRARRRLAGSVAAIAILAGGAGGLWYASQSGHTPADMPPAAVNVPVSPPAETAPPASEAEAPKYSRALTAAERDLAQKLFGDTLDVSQVRINVFEKVNDSVPTFVEAGSKNSIRVNGERFASNDYSREDNAFLFGALAHELTRLWQNQNAQTWRHGNNNEYAYALHSDLVFADYGPLQQAAIMEDYARRFFHKAYQSNWMARTYGENNCSADDFLMRVVESQFPAARAAREQLDKSYIRAPTQAEAATIYGIFGSEITTQQVQVHNAPRSCGPGQIASVNSPRDMFFWSARYHSHDFAQDKKSDNLGNFLHEATHIWQKQNNYRYTNWQQKNSRSMYDYPLDLRKWRFDDYGVEQQAAIIDDYARAFLHAEKTTKWLTRNYHDTDQARDILRRLVEARFPKAAETRMYFEKHGVLPDAPAATPVTAQLPVQKLDENDSCKKVVITRPGMTVTTITCG